MTSSIPFDIEALRQAAGDKRFKRALGLWEGGYVEILDVESGTLVAHVAGENDTYLVEMSDPRGRDAKCSCPDAAELSPICKHMLAVALTANDLSLSVKPTGRFARLREGLELEPRDNLIDQLIRLAKRYPEVLAELEGEDTEN